MLELHKKKLHEAVAAHRIGRLDLAKLAYEELRKSYPENFDVLHLLGLACFQSGDSQRGGKLIARALELNPGSAPANNNLGNILKVQGRFQEAIACFDRAIALKAEYPEALVNRGSVRSAMGQVNGALQDFERALKLVPNYPDAHMGRGMELKNLNRLDEALKAFDAAIILNPRHSEALGNKGSLLIELGRPTEAVAVLESAIKINASLAGNHYNLAIAYLALERLPEALESSDRAISLNPVHAEAYSNRGNILKDLGRPEEALASYEKALSLNAENAETHCSRGNLLKHLRRFDEALESYDRAIGLKSDYAEVYINRGNLLKDLGRLEEACLSFREFVRLKPYDAEAYTFLGELLRDLGQLDEATASFDKAINLDPAFARAWACRASVDAEMGQFEEAERRIATARALDPTSAANLYVIASIRKVSDGDPLIEEINKRLSDSSLNNFNRAQLHHAYAKICNDVGRYDDAMKHLAIGKKLIDMKYDFEKDRALFAWLKQTFTPTFFAERLNFGLPDERPVFIVGMPRSGTTLTEQVLASHHSVQGMGELHNMAGLVSSLGLKQGDPLQFVDAVVRLQRADVARLAESYQQAYASCEPRYSRLIDKMPHNFMWLGLIALMFPRAHIIHCRRNPMDTCVSIYMQNYIANHNYAKDLAVLGKYYLEYESLMRHWEQVLPIRIHDSVYEDNVADLEPPAKAMLDFLGLDWDPNCLNYQNQERQVKTASFWQVRQPLYGTSVDRWRRYEGHLGPLKQVLGVA